MSKLYITEYAEVGTPHAGRVGQTPMEPPLVEQTPVAIGGGSLQSAAFNEQTRIVRIHTDAICSVLFGLDPTASANNARMAANQTEYRTVPARQAFKVAVIANT